MGHPRSSDLSLTRPIRIFNLFVHVSAEDEETLHSPNLQCDANDASSITFHITTGSLLDLISINCINSWSTASICDSNRRNWKPINSEGKWREQPRRCSYWTLKVGFWCGETTAEMSPPHKLNASSLNSWRKRWDFCVMCSEYWFAMGLDVALLVYGCVRLTLLGNRCFQFRRAINDSSGMNENLFPAHC